MGSSVASTTDGEHLPRETKCLDLQCLHKDYSTGTPLAPSGSQDTGDADESAVLMFKIPSV